MKTPKKVKTPEPKPKKVRVRKDPAPGVPEIMKEPKKRGTCAEGLRKRPRTNPPCSEEAAEFGAKVAKARHAMGWTQRQLADKLGEGRHQCTVANIERGVVGAGKVVRAELEKALSL